MNQFPPAPEYSIKNILNFSKIRGDIRKCTTGNNDKFFHKFRWRFWQRLRWEIATGINDTSGKFDTGVNGTYPGQVWVLDNEGVDMAAC